MAVLGFVLWANLAAPAPARADTYAGTPRPECSSNIATIARVDLDGTIAVLGVWYALTINGDIGGGSMVAGGRWVVNGQYQAAAYLSTLGGGSQTWYRTPDDLGGTVVLQPGTTGWASYVVSVPSNSYAGCFTVTDVTVRVVRFNNSGGGGGGGGGIASPSPDPSATPGPTQPPSSPSPSGSWPDGWCYSDAWDPDGDGQGVWIPCSLAPSPSPSPSPTADPNVRVGSCTVLSNGPARTKPVTCVPLVVTLAEGTSWTASVVVEAVGQNGSNPHGSTRAGQNGTSETVTWSTDARMASPGTTTYGPSATFTTAGATAFTTLGSVADWGCCATTYNSMIFTVTIRITGGPGWASPAPATASPYAGEPTRPPGFPSPPPNPLPPEGSEFCPPGSTASACQPNPDYSFGPAVADPDALAVLMDHLAEKAPFGYAAQVADAMADAAGGAAAGAGTDPTGIAGAGCITFPLWSPADAGGTRNVEGCIDWDPLAGIAGPFRSVVLVLFTLGMGAFLIRRVATYSSAG